MKFFIYILVMVIAVSSCTKESDNNSASNTNNPPADSSMLGFLQNKWEYDSIYIYPDANVFGQYLFGFAPFTPQYADFRSDGKIYAHSGFPAVSYDTLNYLVLADSVRFVGHLIKNGVVSGVPDTVRILQLTRNSLMYTNRNPAGEHARYVLRR